METKPTSQTEINQSHQQTSEHVSPVRILPSTLKEFQADSGKTYYVENTLTVERYKAFFFQRGRFTR